MPDTHLNELSRNVPATASPGGIRFYASYPIHSATGEIIATLCMHDKAPHDSAEFNFALLHDLALLAEGELIDARSRVVA